MGRLRDIKSQDESYEFLKRLADICENFEFGMWGLSTGMMHRSFTHHLVHTHGPEDALKAFGKLVAEAIKTKDLQKINTWRRKF